MPLEEYVRKRDFGKTPEPRGGERTGGDGWSFVVQKHAATRLHYDFRLELDGVLKSWAVPKGPSFDPAEKRLAMETEDHPIEYGGFEGVIPEGQYGGGPVVLWDRGTWEPLEEPRAGYAKGVMKFRLHGEKLEGAWTLVRIKSRDPRDRGKSWLLIKERDQTAVPHAKYDVTEARPESVISGRDLDQVARDRDRVWESHVVETKKGGKWKPRVPTERPGTPEVPGRPARAGTGTATGTGTGTGISGARKGGLPKTVAPQLATLVDEPPAGDEWLHELKFDGYRILARVESGRARLLSRNGKDWTESFPAVARAAGKLPCRTALVDGEVAVVLPDGTTSFNALQNAMADAAQGELTYFVFDLLHLDGQDLTGAPLEERKAALLDLVRRGGPVIEPLRYSDHVSGSGKQFFEQACRMKLEGIISKRRREAYRAGRGRGWLKVKCVKEQEFVIGGFTDPEGQRQGIGALLLGVNEDGALRFAGKVGTGFTERVARDLRRRLEALRVDEPPFTPRPPGMKDAHWVRPELVGEVRFTEWTPDGRLRHPSFQGLREDKAAREIVREAPRPTADADAEGPVKKATKKKTKAAPKKAAKKGTRRASPARKAASVEAALPAVAGVRLTNPDRVLYPDQGLTKRDLAAFYEGIADWILPHLQGRPTSLVRCPEGIGEPCFYQKHTGYWAPASLRRVKIQEKTKVGEYLVVDDLAGLIGLVQMGILEIHTWNARTDRLEQPDRVVFDLDPGEGVSWTRVVDAARLLREELQGRGLASFVKTTGGKGLHVLVPFQRGPSWEESYEFTRALAERIAAERPREYLVEMSKAQRVGRIFVDVLRNLRGATSVSAYSTRARAGAPVSTPLAWDELGPGLRPDTFTVANLRRRLDGLREDPWKEYPRLRQRLPPPDRL